MNWSKRGPAGAALLLRWPTHQPMMPVEDGDGCGDSSDPRQAETRVRLRPLALEPVVCSGFGRTARGSRQRRQREHHITSGLEPLRGILFQRVLNDAIERGREIVPDARDLRRVFAQNRRQRFGCVSRWNAREPVSIS